jgi:hypothetical protein
MMSEKNRIKPLMVELTPIECEIDAASHCVAAFIIQNPQVLDNLELAWIKEHNGEQFTSFSEAAIFISQHYDTARRYCEKMLKTIDLYHNEKYL